MIKMLRPIKKALKDAAHDMLHSENFDNHKVSLLDKYGDNISSEIDMPAISISSLEKKLNLKPSKTLRHFDDD